MKRTTKTVASLGAAAALSIGALAVPAIAQTTEGDGDTTTESTEQTKEERRAERQAAFAEALAEELGLDADTVAEAITTVREEQKAAFEAERLARIEERLDARVEAGELTQEQADALKALAESGEGFGPGRRGGPRGHGGPRGGFGPGPSGDAFAPAGDTSA